MPRFAALERQLLELGPVPKHGDDTASKTARLIGLFVSIGSNADEEIAEWRPIAFAIGIELLALIGPIGMVAAVGSPRIVAETQQPAISEEVKSASPETPAPQRAGLPQTAPTPAKPKKARKIKPAALAGVGDVREWHSSRTAAKPGNLARVNECFAAYVEWCKAKGLQACSLTKFGMVMKGELRVEYAEKSKRGYYAGFVLKGAGRRSGLTLSS
jgi:hypothetical protein